MKSSNKYTLWTIPRQGSSLNAVIRIAVGLRGCNEITKAYSLASALVTGFKAVSKSNLFYYRYLQCYTAKDGPPNYDSHFKPSEVTLAWFEAPQTFPRSTLTVSLRVEAGAELWGAVALVVKSTRFIIKIQTPRVLKTAADATVDLPSQS